MENDYSNSDIPSFRLEDRQDEEFFKAKKRSAPHRYPLALLAVLCIALLGGLIALGVLNKQNSNRSNSLEEENSKLSVSLSAMKQKLGDCRSENASFQSGMELRIKGVPKPNPVRYSIDVGHSAQTLALHFDLRFNYYGENRVIVLNSCHNGRWKEEQREFNFPFEAGQEFESKQMDLHVRLWDGAEVKTKYIGSKFLGHSTAVDIVEKTSKVLSETGVHNLIQLSMDGPHVNWKAFGLTQKEVQKQVDKSLLNIGSCGLHIMHNTFRDGCKATGWDIEHKLSSLCWLFRDGPARHEDFVTAAGCSTGMLKFCKHCRLENVSVSDPVLKIWPYVTTYVELVSG
ncbi:hypothetical protein GJAV_G00101510 [Gymnothorax javanicus]|nr:hypothetical protein GJAV_G00101510 [Gymnothorax javanicus]